MFAEMSDQDLLFWWWQYGSKQQAAWYRNVPRRKAYAEIERRNLVEQARVCGAGYVWGDLIEYNFNPPFPPPPVERPAGYRDSHFPAEEVHPNGWLKFWGLRC